MSPCIDDTVKLASLIFSVSQSTCTKYTQTVTRGLHGGHKKTVCTLLFTLQKRTVCTYLSLGVAEDDGLCDGQRVVEVTQRIKLPLLPLHGHEELLDPLKSQLITRGTKQD